MNWCYRFILWALLTGLAQPVYAGDSEIKKDTLEKLESLGLPKVEGPISTLHSEGAESLASELRGGISEMMDFHSKLLGVPSLNVVLAVLNKEDWISYSNLPYGVSNIKYSEPPVITLPVTGDHVVTSGVLDSANITPEIREELQNVGLSFEMAARSFATEAVYHESGHLVARALDMTYKIRWVDEFVANYLSFLFTSKHRPKESAVWSQVLKSLENSEVEFSDRDAFQEKYLNMDMVNYLWYQSQFQKLVEQLIPKYGFSLISELQRIYEECESCRWRSDEFVKAVSRKVPELEGFLAREP